MLRTIRLYGQLGAKFGRVHRFAVGSCAEAVQFMCAMLPGFERELVTSKDRGIGYSVFLGKRNLGPDNLHDPSGDADIRIAPAPMGAKRGGLGQIIIGAIIVVAAVYTGGAAAAGAGAAGGGAAAGGAAAAGGTFLGVSGGYALAAQIGVSMMLGGVAQLLTPTAKGLSTKDGPDNGASYNFNGPVNTTAQGNPVPLLYGEMLIGSATISAGMYAEDQQ